MPRRKNLESGYRVRAWGTSLLVVPAVTAACGAGLLSGGASAATTAHTTATAGTAAPAGPCAGKSQSTIVASFRRGADVYPLRCGTKTWGYTHLADGHEYDPGMIGMTVAQGKKDSRDQSFTYTTSSRACQLYTVTYTVKYNQSDLNHTGIRPQGITDAYKVTESPIHGRQCE